MLDMIARNWWMLLIRGVAAVVFGIAVIVWPGLSLNVLVVVFAAYLFVDGIFAVVTAVSRRDYGRWWLLALEGVIGILAGLAAFLFPGAAVLTFFYIVVFWAISTGVMEILNAIELRKQIDNEWMLILSGVVSILWGILMLAYPGAAILTLLWLFGIAAVVFGALMILLAFRVRNLGSGSTPMRAAR
jgi:uncharacterized membrane protein HdeD (DUF308 family)